jgi:hypothetical protein
MVAEVAKTEKKADLQNANDAVAKAATTAQAERENILITTRMDAKKAEEALRLEGLAAETRANVERLKAVDSGFSEALLAINNQDTLARVAEAMSVQSFVGGKDLVEVMQKAFAGTPLANLMSKVQEGAVVKNGGRKRTTREQPQA